MLTAAPTDQPPGDRSATQAAARAALLRANSAVAVVIVTVLALAALGLWQSLRATRLEKAAQAELWRALLAEARSTRLGQTLDRRARALEMIRRAAGIAPTDELRAEAVAALALPEHHLEATVSIEPRTGGVEFDPSLQRCATGQTNGDVLIRPLHEGASNQPLRAAAASIPADQGAPILFDFAPAGDALSARYMGGALAVWNLPSGTLRFVRDADRPRRPASRGLFSSDGRHLVAPVFEPDGFAVLDAMSGQMVAHFPDLGSFHHAAVRPGTNQFAAYDGDRVKLVDWQTRQTVLTLPLSYGAFRLAWSPDGRWLAIGGNALEIQVHDVIEGRTRVFRGNRDTVYDVHFDVTGQRLAATSSEGASLIWDFADGQLLDLATDRRLLRWGTAGRAGWLVPDQRLELWRTVDAAGYSARRGADETADPWQMDVTADGRSVACLSPGRGLLTWELAGDASPVLVPFPGIVSFGFDPRNPEVHLIRDERLETTSFPSASDGRATGGTGVASWKTEPAQGATRVVTSADGGTRALTQLSPGRVWIRARGQDGEVRIPEIQHSSTAYEPSSPHGAGPIALSPDGRWLACGADGFAGTWIYDTRSGQRVQRLDPRMGGVHFSPDSRWLVLGTPAEVRLFHTADWTEAWSRPREVASSHWFATAAIAPDGRQVAFATSPHQIALLETGTGRELVRIESPGGLPILSLRWSPDGEALLAMERDSSVDIWRPRALQGELARLGLDWSGGENETGEANRARSTALPGWIALGVLLTAGAVAAVALLSLRRHRRLIEDFSRSESLAVSRERELEIERRLSQLKSSFVSMVSHEFRTPLGITMSAVELLQHYSDRIPPEKRGALLADIHSSTRHMSDLMEQVLLLGRAEAGKLGFRPAPVDLPALARRLAEEASLASQQRCPLEVRLEGALEDAVGDEALLRHILSNLLSNATKYSPAGAPVELIVRRESSEAIVQVRDRGIGIPEEDLPQLFQAFHRAGNVGKIPGTGLGLAIVKRCVTLHHGSVEVASPRGAGAEFTVRLPLFSEPPVAGEIRLSSDGAFPGAVA